MPAKERNGDAPNNSERNGDAQNEAGQKQGGKERLILLYDGHCNLCLRSMETLWELPSAACIDMVPLQDADLGELLPGARLSQNDLLAQLHLIDRSSGEIFRGADAVIRVLRTVPRLAWLERIYRLPGMRPVARILYRWIAKHRYKLFGRKEDDCDSGTCQLHQSQKTRRK